MAFLKIFYALILQYFYSKKKITHGINIKGKKLELKIIGQFPKEERTESASVHSEARNDKTKSASMLLDARNDETKSASMLADARNDEKEDASMLLDARDVPNLKRLLQVSTNFFEKVC